MSHLAKVHVRVWIEGPLQGLLVASHDLPLCWVPVPHVTVHSVHSDQGDQPSALSLAANSQIHETIQVHQDFLAPVNSAFISATKPS